MSHKVRLSKVRLSNIVSTQEEHHKRVTFQDQYQAFLKRHHVSFDEWHVLDQLESQLFLRPYRASRPMGSLPRLKPWARFSHRFAANPTHTQA
jgi:hypothetical protein